MKPARLLGQSLGAVRWQRRAQLGLGLGQRPRPDSALLGAGGGPLTLQGGSAKGEVDCQQTAPHLCPRHTTQARRPGRFSLYPVAHQTQVLLLPPPMPLNPVSSGSRRSSLEHNAKPCSALHHPWGEAHTLLNLDPETGPNKHPASSLSPRLWPNLILQVPGYTKLTPCLCRCCSLCLGDPSCSAVL